MWCPELFVFSIHKKLKSISDEIENSSTADFGLTNLVLLWFLVLFIGWIFILREFKKESSQMKLNDKVSGINDKSYCKFYVSNSFLDYYGFNLIKNFMNYIFNEGKNNQNNDCACASLIVEMQDEKFPFRNRCISNAVSRILNM